ncbi:MAG: hypothetical protein R3F14_07925 [Polyangiaceae bacterium]
MADSGASISTSYRSSSAVWLALLFERFVSFVVVVALASKTMSAVLYGSAIFTSTEALAALVDRPQIAGQHRP